MEKKLVTNGKEFAVLTNPIGDEKLGFLHWDDIQFFKTREGAIDFINRK